MAAPVAGYVQLPLDTGNTGKKVRTQSRVVGADTVHEHFFVPISVRKLTGLYFASNAVLSVQASAQNGTATAHWWFQVPSGASVRARIRRLEIGIGITATTTMPTAPRIVLNRYTFTGTASGATVTPAKRNSGDATNVADMRTAVTGMTVSMVAAMVARIIPGAPLTTSGWGMPWANLRWDPSNEDEFIDLAAGEGVLLYQPDAGTASDTRRMSCTLVWDEYDNV